MDTLLRYEDWSVSLSNIGIKPESKVLDKGIARIQKLLDQLQKDIDSLEARVTALEN